jgi:hypothetical protein
MIPAAVTPVRTDPVRTSIPDDYYESVFRIWLQALQGNDPELLRVLAHSFDSVDDEELGVGD